MNNTEKEQKMISEIEDIMRDAAGQISLAALGNLLFDRLGQSFREYFPDTTLVGFIAHHLPNKILISGPPTGLVAVLSPSMRTSQPEIEDGNAVRAAKAYDRLPGPARKYESNFWAAFITPARHNRNRAIKPIAPFEWGDFPDKIPPDFIQIDASLIPNKSEPWLMRKRVAGDAIEKWCEANGLDPNDFSDSASGRQGRALVKQSGAQTLLNMVSAVDEEERGRLSLSFAIIYALLRH